MSKEINKRLAKVLTDNDFDFSLYVDTRRGNKLRISLTHEEIDGYCVELVEGNSLIDLGGYSDMELTNLIDAFNDQL